MSARPETAGLAPSYADIEALPPHVVGEIIDGELVVSPRPAPPHANATSVLGSLLNTSFQLGMGGPGGWWIVDEPELSLGVDARYDPIVADIAGWRLETMPAHPLTAQYTVVPDWVCETLSPGTARRDRGKKLPFYGRAGVSHVWLVDPVEQLVEVFRLDEKGWVLAGVYGGGDIIRAEPFEAIELPLSHLWNRGQPAEPTAE